MTETQKHRLLQVAAQSIKAAIAGGEPPDTHKDDPALREHCGCFVTLKNNEQLRGCLGQFTSDKPLIDLVAQMARASATADPRFYSNPVTSEELPELDIEISALSPLKRTDDPLSLKLGEHGIYIKQGVASGCFLPQVATETGWSKEEFLSFCCSHKAGLAPNAWKDPQTEVYLFTAEIFGGNFSDI